MVSGNTSNLQIEQKQLEIEKFNMKYRLVGKPAPYKLALKDDKVELLDFDLQALDVENDTLLIKIPDLVEYVDFDYLFVFSYLDTLNNSGLSSMCDSLYKIFEREIHLIIEGNDNTLYGNFAGLGWVYATEQDVEYSSQQPLKLKSIEFRHFDARGFEYLDFKLNGRDFPWLKSIDIRGMQLKKVKAISDFSRIYKSQPGYDWQKVDFSAIRDQYRMFKGTGVTAQDIEQSFKQLRPVKSMTEMFYSCKSLQRIPDIGVWNCENTSSMFRDSGLSGDLVIKDVEITQNLNYRTQMFLGSKIKRLVIDNVKFDACLNNSGKFDSMFQFCYSLEEVIIQNIECQYNLNYFNKQNPCAIWLNEMFQNCHKLRKVIFRNIDLSDCIVDTCHMFLRCGQLEAIELHNITVNSFRVPSMQFRHCGNLQNIIIDNVKVRNPLCLSSSYGERSPIKRDLLRMFDDTMLKGSKNEKEYLECLYGLRDGKRL